MSYPDNSVIISGI